MNKRGFSLVEVIAVILILSIIFSITMIIYTDAVKNRQENDYSNIVSMIEENTKVLVTTDFDVSNKIDDVLMKEDSEEVKECKIPYSLLIQKGLMDSDTKDPRKRNKIINENSFVIVTSNINDVLEYQFVNMDEDEENYETNLETSNALVNCLN